MMHACGWVSFEAPAGACRDAFEALALERGGSVERGEGFGFLTLGDDTTVTRGIASATAIVAGRARTRSDSAVDPATQLAREYSDEGSGALNRVAGAFIAVVVDFERRRCLVATDRFASIPVYHRRQSGGIVFATRLDLLLQLTPADREIDSQAVYDYAFFHCVPSPRTIYRGVSKLGPASVLALHETRSTTSVYWHPRFRNEPMTRAEVDASGDALQYALDAAVRDATTEPIGAFLSGGLDSTTIAGVLKRTSGRATTFTIGFDEPEYDESGFAKVSADHFGAVHHVARLTPDSVALALEDIVGFLEEPFGNSSVLPTYFCAKLASDNGISTMLAGDGGDELFAGNTRYMSQDVFERYARVPRPVRAVLEHGYAFAPFLRKLPIVRKGYGYITKANMGLPDRLLAYALLNQFEPESVFEPGFLAGTDPEEPWRQWRRRYGEPHEATTLQRMLYLDWKFTLADNDLVKVSTMCEMAGVRVAYPMLDDRVVDVSIGIDSDAMLLDGELRGFYKHAWRDVLPPSVFTKSKHGFGLPFGVWLHRDPSLNRMATASLEAIRAREIFQPSFIDTAIHMHASDTPGYWGELVWILMVLEMWLAKHT